MRNERRKGILQRLRGQKTTIEAEMSFFDHLNELRGHLIRSVIAVFIFTGIAFYFKEFIFDKIILGPKNLDFWTYQMMCRLADTFNFKDFCIDKINFIIMNTAIAGQFTIHITTSIYAGIIAAFPYFVWEMWRFIKPALHDTERKSSTGIVSITSLLFITGVLFGYFLIVPLTITFLGSYTVSDEIINQITLDSYIGTISTLTLGCGITFELPIVIYFLSRIGMMTPEFMRQNRRYAIVLILILAAFITPSPDILTQLLVATPLFLLFEISIYVSAWVVKKRKQAELDFFNS